MAKDKLNFSEIFEGEEIKPEMKNKISDILNDVVNKKVQARLNEEEEEEEEEEDDEKEKKEKKEEGYVQNPDNKENDVLTNEEDPEEEKEKEEEEEEEDPEEASMKKEEEEEDPEEKEKEEEEEEKAYGEEEEEEEEEYSQNPDNKENDVLTNEEEPEEKIKEEEGHMTKDQMAKRDEIVKAMMKGSAGMKNRYGSRWKEVMYATATKQAMEENRYDIDEDIAADLVGKLGDMIQNVNIKRVGTSDEKAFNKSISKFKTAFTAAFRDLANNKMAAPAVEFIANLMNAIASDPTLSTRIAADIRKQEKVAAKAEMEEAVSEKIDKYLSYVAEQWAADNKLALENGIKVQLAESFLKRFDELYSQFNFKSVPERDMVVEMTQKVVEAETRLNEEIEKNASLLDQANKQKKENLINEATKGLTVTQTEKFKKLVESVTFEDASSFGEKLKTIKETAFIKETPKGEVRLDESVNVETEANPRIAKYVDAISKNLKF